MGLTAEGSGEKGAVDLVLIPQSVTQAASAEHLLCARCSEGRPGLPLLVSAPSLGPSPAVTPVPAGPGFRRTFKEKRIPLFPPLPHPAKLAQNPPLGSRALQAPGQLSSLDGHALPWGRLPAVGPPSPEKNQPLCHPALLPPLTPSDSVQRHRAKHRAGELQSRCCR